MSDPKNEPLVEMLFRNGTLTVVGILLSFSLTFLTQWAQNPIPWTLVDLPTLILLTLGIVTQGYSLALFLKHDSLRRSVYDRAARWFLAGISFTGAGVISAILVDLFLLVT